MAMNLWERYSERVGVAGEMRDVNVYATQSAIYRRIMNSPSYREITINGIKQGVTITHRQNMAEKRICALPGERLKHGGIAEFAGGAWLITEVDADSEVYERGIMLRCNHKLRWIGRDGQVKEKWCVVEDGTKYLIGEYSEDIMSIGDARIALTISKDEDTIELRRGMRFLIDDEDSDTVLAYQITKPNKLFNIYHGEGVFKFILNEVTLTDNDNVEMRIADYTSWKPPESLDGDHKDSELTVDEITSNAKEDVSQKPADDKKGWI